MLDLSPYLFAKQHLSDASLFTSSAVSETDVYITNAFKLIDSLVIHCVGTQTQMISANIINNGQLPDALPEEQTYYKNLFGIYGQWDASMEVYSIDTGHTIPLDKETIDDHPLTKSELLLKSTLYKRLVSKYPLKAILIEGILNPVDFTRSTVAKDGDILYYDRSLISSNELTLIEDIQGYIHGYFKRYVNWSYLHTDNLYAAVVLSILYGQLVAALLNYRLDRCKTLEVHPFHIHQYLKSNGLDDNDLSILSLKQKLWFYRNITDIKKHRGHERIFKALVKVLTEDTNLLVGGYHHELVHQDRDIQSLFTRKDILTGAPSEEKTLVEFKEMELPIAVGNKDISVRDYRRGIENTPSTTTKTKSLSVHGGQNEVLEVARAEFLLSTWAHASQTGMYTSEIPIVLNPEVPSVPLSIKDAFMYAALLSAKLSGDTSTVTPCDIYLPLIQTTDKITHPATDTDNDNINLLNLYIVPDKQTSKPSEFVQHVRRAYQGYLDMSELIASTEDSHLKTALITEQDRIYNSVDVFELSAGGYPIDQWLSDRGLIIPDTEPDQMDIFKQVLLTAIGVDVNKYKVGQANGIVNLMTKLMSYTVNFIENVDQSIDTAKSFGRIIGASHVPDNSDNPPCGHKWWRIRYDTSPTEECGHTWWRVRAVLDPPP